LVRCCGRSRSVIAKATETDILQAGAEKSIASLLALRLLCRQLICLDDFTVFIFNDDLIDCQRTGFSISFTGSTYSVAELIGPCRTAPLMRSTGFALLHLPRIHI
jgi:hypothetical protein